MSRITVPGDGQYAFPRCVIEEIPLEEDYSCRLPNNEELQQELAREETYRLWIPYRDLIAPRVKSMRGNVAVTSNNAVRVKHDRDTK